MKPVLFIGLVMSSLVYVSANPTEPGPANGPTPLNRDCRTTGCLNGECVDAGAVSRCICYPGFILNPGDSSVCSDIDECRLPGGSICGYGRCVNRPGSWLCQCYPYSISINRGTYCRYSPWYSGRSGQRNEINPYSLLMWSFFADNM